MALDHHDLSIFFSVGVGLISARLEQKGGNGLNTEWLKALFFVKIHLSLVSTLFLFNDSFIFATIFFTVLIVLPLRQNDQDSERDEESSGLNIDGSRTNERAFFKRGND